VNAAAPAVREPFSYDWFDFDLNFDISFPGAYGGTDFDNRGQQASRQLVEKVDNFLYFNLGAQLQFGDLGTSVTGEFLQYTLSPAQANTPGLNLTLGRYHALAAYGISGNQFVIGSGLRGVTAQINQTGGGVTGRTLLTMTGIAPEVGAVIKPNNLPYRLGASLRAPVSGKSFGRGAIEQDQSGVVRAGPFILPSQVVLPWEFEAGIAFQLGPRPLNPAWINPHDVERPLSDKIAAARAMRAHENAVELDGLPPDRRVARRAEMLREEQSLRAIEDEQMDTESRRLREIRKTRFDNWPRERLLILASLLIAGASDNAVAMEGLLEQKLDYVGRSISLIPRFGFESEPIVNLLRARVGSYIEPSRFDDGHARQHFTFGADFRLFPFSPFGLLGDQVWRIGFAADLSPRYANWGLSIGAWH
jgi:hypothetical protein